MKIKWRPRSTVLRRLQSAIFQDAQSTISDFDRAEVVAVPTVFPETRIIFITVRGEHHYFPTTGPSARSGRRPSPVNPTWIRRECRHTEFQRQSAVLVIFAHQHKDSHPRAEGHSNFLLGARLQPAKAGDGSHLCVAF